MKLNETILLAAVLLNPARFGEELFVDGVPSARIWGEANSMLNLYQDDAEHGVLELIEALEARESVCACRPSPANSGLGSGCGAAFIPEQPLSRVKE